VELRTAKTTNNQTKMKDTTQMKTFNSNMCRILFATCFSALCLIAPSTQAATITVTNTNDSGAGSLRQALADAVNGDTINFNPSLNGQTIMLTNGELLVTRNVAINGPGANMLAVDSNHASRLFYIAAGKDVTISGLTISNGKVISDFGGGIYNDNATLTLSSCTISGNTIDFGIGGGIYNDGVNGGATLTVSNCTISGNSAYFGGGIYNYVGTVTLTNTTLSGNYAESGGGAIRNEGTLTITNSTLSGNFCANSPDDHGGGIYNTGTLKIGDTILKVGPSGENVYNVQPIGSVTSLGYNLSSDNGGGYLTATGDRITTDPMLGPLQNNGGPTFTHLPESNSPAIDAGDPTLGMDQRGSGFVRVMNGRIDIGAVEAQATPTPTPTPTPHGHKRH
jgi:predicted outer membrane repeat protein